MISNYDNIDDDDNIDNNMIMMKIGMITIISIT